MKEIRSRCYHLVLYKEDLEHLRVIDLIEQHYNYACILHDKDLSEKTGDVKKEHYHYILYFENAISLNSLANQLELKPNYIRTEELRKGLLYLIHYNHKDKYQYSVDEVEGPLKDRLLNYLSSSIQNESTSINLLFNIINSFEGPIKLEDFIPIVLQNNLWSFFRRSQLTWFKLIEEHNRKYHLTR